MRRQSNTSHSGGAPLADPTCESLELDPNAPRALIIGLKLLEHLSTCPSPMTVSALAMVLGITGPAARRSLLVLEQRGYVMRTDTGGSYTRTGKLFVARSTPLSHQRLLGLARPIMRALADEISQSCNLSIPCSQDMLVIAHEESPGPFGINIPIGFRYDIPAAAAGLVFATFMKNSDPAGWPDGDSSVVGPDQWQSLRSAVKKTTETGFAQVPNHNLPDVTDLACPIFARHHLAAVLTIPYLKTNRGPNVAWCLAALQQAAGALNDSLLGDALVA